MKLSEQLSAVENKLNDDLVGLTEEFSKFEQDLESSRQSKAEEMVDFNLILFRNTLDRSTKFND